MSDIKIERSHKLGAEEAKNRFLALEAKLKERYGVCFEWNGSSARVTGTAVKGDVQIADDRITINLKLGLLARAFAGKIQAAIERQVDEKLIRA